MLSIPGFRKRSSANVSVSLDIIHEKANHWGPATPVPCPAYGLRLTDIWLIHGSTAEGTQRRRSLFPHSYSVYTTSGTKLGAHEDSGKRAERQLRPTLGE